MISVLSSKETKKIKKQFLFSQNEQIVEEGEVTVMDFGKYHGVYEFEKSQKAEALTSTEEDRKCILEEHSLWDLKEERVPVTRHRDVKLQCTIRNNRG